MKIPLDFISNINQRQKRTFTVEIPVIFFQDSFISNQTFYQNAKPVVKHAESKQEDALTHVQILEIQSEKINDTRHSSIWGKKTVRVFETK